MNEIERAKAAKIALAERRMKFAHLPEPEQTYAHEFNAELEIIRLKEELTEVR